MFVNGIWVQTVNSLAWLLCLTGLGSNTRRALFVQYNWSLGIFLGDRGFVSRCYGRVLGLLKFVPDQNKHVPSTTKLNIYVMTQRFWSNLMIGYAVFLNQNLPFWFCVSGLVSSNINEVNGFFWKDDKWSQRQFQINLRSAFLMTPAILNPTLSNIHDQVYSPRRSQK